MPEVIADHAGAARIEASTVIFDREGAPDFGVVIARTRDGARLMAHVAAEDRVSLDLLLAMDASPVGMDGMVRTGTEGLPHWAA